MLVADLSPTVQRKVSPWKGQGSLQCSGDLSVTDQRWGSDRSALYRRLVGDQLQSGFQACAHHSAMSLQTSLTCLISQQVLEEFRLTVKNGTQKFGERRRSCYPRSQPVHHLPSPYQLSVYHHGNNCSILIYSVGAATATIQLLIIWKLAKKWFDYEKRPFYMLLIENLSTVSHCHRPVTTQVIVTNQSPLSCNQTPIIHRLVAYRSQQIASVSPYIRLTVADRSPINRWQVAKPIAD